MSEVTPNTQLDTLPSPRAKLIRKIVLDLSLMTIIGVALALIGPLGSFQMPFYARLISWLLFAYVGYAIYSPMGAVVDRLEAALDLPRYGLWIAACAVATVPMAAVVWIFGYLPRPIPLPSLEAGLLHYFYVFIVGCGITAVFNMVEMSKRGKVAEMSGGVVPLAANHHPAAPDPNPEADKADEADTVRFFDRLPPALGTNLLALEMEDHYVRAHTALGSELILMRMRDAVAELDGVEGSQVHRSWWVARDAVESTKREGRNLRLKLTGGLEAPISRNMAPQLKTLGWF